MDPTEEMLPGDIELSEQQRAAIQQDIDARNAQMSQESEQSTQTPTQENTPEVEETQIEPDPEQVDYINNEPFLKVGNETLDNNLPEVTKAGLAMGAGLVDWGIDAINMLTGVSPEQDKQYGIISILCRKTKKQIISVTDEHFFLLEAPLI